ncbi:hypothetical protein [Sinosporangium album]|nr:hypothetical protein [Sinosporangium album]
MRDVYVAGRPLLRGGELKTLGEERILFGTRRIAACIGLAEAWPKP